LIVDWFWIFDRPSTLFVSTHRQRCFWQPRTEMGVELDGRTARAYPIPRVILLRAVSL